MTSKPIPPDKTFDEIIDSFDLLAKQKMMVAISPGLFQIAVDVIKDLNLRFRVEMELRNSQEAWDQQLFEVRTTLVSKLEQFIEQSNS